MSTVYPGDICILSRNNYKVYLPHQSWLAHCCYLDPAQLCCSYLTAQCCTQNVQKHFYKCLELTDKNFFLTIENGNSSGALKYFSDHLLTDLTDLSGVRVRSLGGCRIYGHWRQQHGGDVESLNVAEGEARSGHLKSITECWLCPAALLADWLLKLSRYSTYCRNINTRSRARCCWMLPAAAAPVAGVGQSPGILQPCGFSR